MRLSRSSCGRICRTVLVALFLLVAVGGQAAAQPLTTEPDPEGTSDLAPEANRAPEQEPGLASDLASRIQILEVEETEDEIVIEVAVPPAIGRLAAIGSNFAITDGGRLVDVAVAPIDTAVDTVVVLDTSGSMRGSALEAAKAAASGFIEALPDAARVGLISFGDLAIIHRTPTLDRSVLLADLDGLAADGTETVLWDALVVAADMVGQSEPGSSSIVVLSDGDDTASVARPADIVRRLGVGSGPLYAVAIESPDTDLEALEEAVDLVGGQFLATTDLGQLDSLYTDIAGRLTNRYRLRFESSLQGERTIVVSVAADGTVATARTTVGEGLGSVTPAPAPGEESSTGPAPVLNLGDEVVLGPVVAQAASPLTSTMMLWIGIGSMFTAFALVGLSIARPSAQVRLDAASSVDRVGGINARLGQATDRLITRHDQGRKIDSRLEAADISIRPGEFVVAWLLATAMVTLLATAVVGVVLGTLMVPTSALIAFLFLTVRANRRRARFADQLTDTLSIMSGSLRAGQSLPRAIELVAAEAPSPTAEQFHRVSFEIRVGRDLTESIRGAARRTASPDLEWLAQAVDIHRELGGDLSEIMDNVASTIRERRTIARQIDALSAEGRATAWVLLAMPMVLFLFSWWRTPENISTLLTEPIGRLLLIAAIAGMTIGHIWIRHLVKLKY